MGGRAVEGTGLENRQACKRLVGSNPTPSAIRRHRNSGFGGIDMASNSKKLVQNCGATEADVSPKLQRRRTAIERSATTLTSPGLY